MKQPVPLADLDKYIKENYRIVEHEEWFGVERKFFFWWVSARRYSNGFSSLAQYQTKAEALAFIRSNIQILHPFS